MSKNKPKDPAYTPLIGIRRMEDGSHQVVIARRTGETYSTEVYEGGLDRWGAEDSLRAAVGALIFESPKLEAL